ncbi:hypothetical protein Javan273_0021 [Streptococcus phage Javan273]|nr:hypothetical protein BKX95_00305 [Streptococcus iniae]QBX16763.1 hypothetical protein Javan273_0021 [Streptococcus phage Javan273]
MNKRIKEKRKLKIAIVMLIAENAMQAEAIKHQNAELATLRASLIDQQELTNALSESIAELQDYILNSESKKPFWHFWK